jgi:uncharacterized protein (TIGR02611 family)
MQSMKKNTKKLFVGISGGAVLLFGIIAIPYPGPGWLIVFAGLAILSTEFEWAGRLLEFGRDKYDAWTRWLKSQPPATRIGILTLMGIIIVTTIWLLNGFGLMNRVLHLPFSWLESPLF